LAKFLVPLIQPLAKSELIIEDVYGFVNEINNICLDTKSKTVSVDIESLFTNVSNIILNGIIESSYAHIKLRVIFTPVRTMRSLFKITDTTSFGLRSDIVSKYNCAGCGACYVGKTI
jgi:hypothetical protein